MDQLNEAISIAIIGGADSLSNLIQPPIKISELNADKINELLGSEY